MIQRRGLAQQNLGPHLQQRGMAPLHGVAAAQDPAAVQAPEVQVRGRAEADAVRGAQPAATLTGDTLRRSLSNTLGETVSEMAGTHNSSFGPGVGVPVIRGMSGPRVKLAVDGIGTHDASAMSPWVARLADAEKLVHHARSARLRG